VNHLKMNTIPIALAPLPEQHRVVARVGHPLALVEQLENRLAASR
jgi:hypothetical protein